LSAFLATYNSLEDKCTSIALSLKNISTSPYNTSEETLS
jgi:hypothetical protein